MVDNDQDAPLGQQRSQQVLGDWLRLIGQVLYLLGDGISSGALVVRGLLAQLVLDQNW